MAAPAGGMDLVWDMVSWLHHHFRKAKPSRAEVTTFFMNMMMPKPIDPGVFSFDRHCLPTNQYQSVSSPVWVLCLCHMARKSLMIPALASDFLNKEYQQRVYVQISARAETDVD